MEQNFVPSQIVNNILQIIKRNKKALKVTDSKLPMDTDRIYNAAIKICKCWNSRQELREFIIELIDRFLPFNSSRKVDVFKSEKLAHDAILRDVELAGIDEILSICKKFTLVKERSDNMYQKQFEAGDRQSFKEREDKIREWVADQPYKIIHADFGYYSPGYKKYLCRESVRALQIFVQEAAKLNEPTIVNILANKKQKAYNSAIAKNNKSIKGNIDNAEELYSIFNGRTLK